MAAASPRGKIGKMVGDLIRKAGKKKEKKKRNISFISNDWPVDLKDR